MTINYTANTDFNSDGEFSECELDTSWATLQVKKLLETSTNSTIEIGGQTFYVYDDSIWLTKFKEWSILPYSLNVLLDVQSIQFDLPDYVYWIGRVNNFADLRKRSTDIRKKRKHNFKTMRFWG